MNEMDVWLVLTTCQEQVRWVAAFVLSIDGQYVNYKNCDSANSPD
jgi:hypothetical protein